MAFTITVSHPSGDYIFAITPEFKPRYNIRHNRSAEPPVVASVEEVWEINNAFLVNSDSNALHTDFKALRDKLIDRTNQVTGLVFKNGVTVLETLSTATHRGFEVLELETADGPAMWTNYMQFNIRAHGYKGLVDGSLAGDKNYKVSELSISLEYTYDQAGFITKSLKGQLVTEGTSAEAQARLWALTLPSGGLWRYLTKGPEGINVKIEDYPGDRRASFESTISNQGETLAANVYDLKSDIATEIRPFYTLNTITVAALGKTSDDALNAVLNLAPTGSIVGWAVSSTKANSSATGTFTYITGSTSPNGTLEFEWEVSVHGGAKGLTEFRIPGGSDPAIVRNSLSAFEVTESIRAITERELVFPITGTLYPDNYDDDASVFSKKRITKFRNGLPYDNWQYTISRVYRFENRSKCDLAAILGTALAYVGVT